MRTDSPTGSRDSFFPGSFLRSTRILESRSCRRHFCILASRRNRTISLVHDVKRQPTPGCEPGEVRVARGSIYGTRDAGRSQYQHFRDRLANKFRVHESAVEKDSISISSTVGSLFSDDFVFCGRRVRVTPEASIVSPEHAASSLAPMKLCASQRSSETMLTYSEHREYRSLLGKLQWLQLQSRPDLSYKVNRAAQRCSASTVADARALNPISLKAQRSSETTFRYPSGVINVSSAQLVTHGDASFANMEGSKSQCGVIVFLTHEPRRFWHGEFQLGHLFYWTSSTIKRVVRSTLVAEAYSVSEAFEEAQWPHAAFCSGRSHTILEDSGDGFLAQTDCDTLRFFQSLPSCQVRQKYWIGQATPNRVGNAGTSLLWSTGSDTCIRHDSHDARRCFDEGPGPFSFLAMSSEPMPTLKMAIGSQLIRSAESHSGRSGPCTD